VKNCKRCTPLVRCDFCMDELCFEQGKPPGTQPEMLAEKFYDFVFRGKTHTVAVTVEKDLDEVPATHDDILVDPDGGYTFVFVGDCVTQEMVDLAKDMLCEPF